MSLSGLLHDEEDRRKMKAINNKENHRIRIYSLPEGILTSDKNNNNSKKKRRPLSVIENTFNFETNEVKDNKRKRRSSSDQENHDDLGEVKKWRKATPWKKRSRISTLKSINEVDEQELVQEEDDVFVEVGKGHSEVKKQNKKSTTASKVMGQSNKVNNSKRCYEEPALQFDNKVKNGDKGQVSEVDNNKMFEDANKRFDVMSFLEQDEVMEVDSEDLKDRGQDEVFAEISKRIPSVNDVLPESPQKRNSEDDEIFGGEEYWSEFMIYLKSVEFSAVFPAKKLSDKNNPKLASHRLILMDWVIELAFFLRLGQETLYHSVRMIDHVMTLRSIPKTHLQQLAVACVLVASKLEEYYPADVQQMVQMADNSFSCSDVYQMEARVLEVIDFHSYGSIPMPFIDRLVRVADSIPDEEKPKLTHMATFFVDIFIPQFHYSALTCSRKAAAAVWTAICAFYGEFLKFYWTERLKTESGYGTEDLAEITSSYLELATKVKSSKGVWMKYKSKSQHLALLKSEEMNPKRIERLYKENNSMLMQR